MSQSEAILPKMEKVLVQVGDHIKLARLRRKLSTERVAERANISRPTLWNIERGAGGVAFAAYVQVLFVLGLEKRFALYSARVR
ncbi:MAG TPA: helix-turn-helix transcriptional regulator [Puia sp.]|nr:helix-turn-helix transcriptional regulator [Puia sp.]